MSPPPARMCPPPAREFAVPDRVSPRLDRMFPAPAREIAVPAREIAVPAREIAAPAREIAAPAPEIAAPAPEIAVPTPEIAAPAREIAVPAPEIAVPARLSAPRCRAEAGQSIWSRSCDLGGAAESVGNLVTAQLTGAPTSLVRDAFRTEVLGGLADAGEEVLHVFLEADADVPRERLSASARAGRRRTMHHVRRGAAWRPESGPVSRHLSSSPSWASPASDRGSGRQLRPVSPRRPRRRRA